MKCEVCLKNDSEMVFTYILPAPYEFTPEISNDPNILNANICFDCFGSALSDAHIVIAVANNRKTEKE